METLKEQDPECGRGFNGLYYLEVVFICLTFAAFLGFALMGLGSTHGVGVLLLPLALGVAVCCALRLRMRGAIAVTLITSVLSVAFVVFEWGAFRSGAILHPYWCVFGVISLFALVSVIVAIVTGYSLRSVSILAHQNNMLYKLFDALPVGIWVRSRSGETVFVNERWLGFSSKSKQGGLDCHSSEAPVDRGALWEREAVEVLNAEEGAIRYQVMELADPTRGKSDMTLLTLRIFIDEIDDFGTLSLLVDETVLHLYEDQIRMSERSLRMALDNAEMGFWGQDLETEQVTCDQNWLKIIGAEGESQADPLQLWRERIHADDRERVHTAYRDYFEGEVDSIRIDYRIRKGTEGYVWVQDCVSVVERLHDGSIKRIMGTMQDITERKQREIELRHAKDKAEMASDAKGQFIATISHEIRTPLNAIIGLSSFLAESELDEDQLDLTQTINKSGNSLLVLVNEILDFSRIESGRLDLEIQEYPLHLCFRECVKLFQVRAEERGLGLLLNIDKSLPEFALGDMERLRQIVQNLLSNALKFTDAGEVEIGVEAVELAALPKAQRPDPFVKVGYLDGGTCSYLKVTVRDTGMGIPEGRQHVLFQAFSQVDASTTRKYGGTGLGLAISKRLVDAMGGVIWLESVEGEGAVFSFVVRTELIQSDGALSTLTPDLCDEVTQISDAHPCGILVVGPKEATDQLVRTCRHLGYVPHQCIDFDLSSGAFMRRHYDVIFIWMGDEPRALDLSREIGNRIALKKTASIIGYAPRDRAVSIEVCKLSGLNDVMNAPMRPLALSRLILSVQGVRD